MKKWSYLKIISLKQIKLFIGFTSFFCFSYLLFLWIEARHAQLILKAQQAQQQFEEKSRKLNMLQNVFGNIDHIFISDKPFPISSIEKLLTEIAKKNYFFRFQFNIFSGKFVHQDAKLSIKKVPIQLSFIVQEDEQVWKFLKNLYQLFPGIIVSQSLLLEKVCDPEKKKVILKGKYYFEWYSLQFFKDMP